MWRLWAPSLVDQGGENGGKGLPVVNEEQWQTVLLLPMGSPGSYASEAAVLCLVPLNPFLLCPLCIQLCHGDGEGLG